MKILLAPSESKESGGSGSFLIENLQHKSLIPFQKEVLRHYEKHILSLSDVELCSWFGLKNIDEAKKYQKTLEGSACLKAIQRYSGVAFDALEYDSLNSREKEYLDKNLLIFSNLFGVLSANEPIPNYKFKQGAKLPNIELENYYNQNISSYLDEFLGDEVIDLRAGFYEKFYKVKKAEVLSFKFTKNGKVVSHWAKFYRGKLLQYLAKNQVDSIKKFMGLEFDDLKLVEIQQKKNIKLLVMDIL